MEFIKGFICQIPKTKEQIELAGVKQMVDENPDLRKLIDGWKKLSLEQRREILAMLE